MRDRVAVLAALAPVMFVLHFLEEAPGFVAWFNSHVARGIKPALFWQVNIAALVVTCVVALLCWIDDSAGSAVIAAGWFGFLFGANAILHVAGAIADRAYVPGLITAVVLYVPFFALFLHGARRRAAPWRVLGPVAILCGAPMLVHGYRIIFLGTRLF